MEYSSWYAAILFFTVNFLTTDADMRICRGDQMVHAIIRVCTGARYMLAKDVVLQSPTITTEDAPTTDDDVDGQYDSNLSDLESLIHILYAYEPDDDSDVDLDRPKRAAVMEDEVLPGSNISRLRQLSRLLRKCCTSCTVDDIAGVCPRGP